MFQFTGVKGLIYPNRALSLKVNFKRKLGIFRHYLGAFSNEKRLALLAKGPFMQGPELHPEV